MKTKGINKKMNNPTQGTAVLTIKPNEYRKIYIYNMEY